jgi:hypothetical protein
MARDIARIQLPVPPLEYDVAYERMRNARIEDLIRSRAAVNELAPYGGVPHAALIGSSTAFSTPGSNAITLLPFDTVFVFNKDLIVGTDWKLAYNMDLTVFLSLFHNSGAGGNTDITLYLFVNGVQAFSSTRSTQLNNNETYQTTVFAKDIPGNAVLDVRISHSGAQALILDMTKSRLWFEQLTPDPAYTQSDTRP